MHFKQTALCRAARTQNEQRRTRSVVELPEEVGQLRLAMEQQGRLAF
jgi:hypothetical protein